MKTGLTERGKDEGYIEIKGRGNGKNVKKTNVRAPNIRSYEW